VEGHKSRTSKRASARISENCLVGWPSKGCDVPPLAQYMWTCVAVDPGNGIAVVHFKTGIRDRCVATVYAGCRESGSNHIDATDLPASKNLVRRCGPVGAPFFSVAKRKRVNSTIHEVVLNVKCRGAVVESIVENAGGGY